MLLSLMLPAGGALEKRLPLVRARSSVCATSPLDKVQRKIAILTGVRASGADDDQVLAAMMPVLDALYTTFSQETP
jgi:hypothetical protein